MRVFAVARLALLAAIAAAVRLADDPEADWEAIQEAATGKELAAQARDGVGGVAEDGVAKDGVAEENGADVVAESVGAKVCPALYRLVGTTCFSAARKTSEYANGQPSCQPIIDECEREGAHLASKEETHLWIDHGGDRLEMQFGLTSATFGAGHYWFTSFSDDHGWHQGECDHTNIFWVCATAQDGGSSDEGIGTAPVIPDVIPDVLPDVMPDVLPDVMPDVMPGVIPASEAGGKTPQVGGGEMPQAGSYAGTYEMWFEGEHVDNMIVGCSNGVTYPQSHSLHFDDVAAKCGQFSETSALYIDDGAGNYACLFRDDADLRGTFYGGERVFGTVEYRLVEEACKDEVEGPGPDVVADPKPDVIADPKFEDVPHKWEDQLGDALDGVGKLGNNARQEANNRMDSFTTSCKMETVIDPQKCGVKIVDGFKDELACRGCAAYDKHCKHPWCPKCPARCKTNTEIPQECQVKAICSYRLRATVRGEVFTGAFENLTVSLEAVKFEVVDADASVAEILGAATDELNVHLPGLVNAEINKQLAPRVAAAKTMVETTLLAELSKDRDVFGAFSKYISMDTFVDNVTDFVREMLPSSSLATGSGSMAASESNETIDTITSALTLDSFQSYVIANVCESVEDVQFYWVRMLPFLAVALAVAYKYPRTAVAVVLVGVGFNLSFSSRLCHRLTPRLTTGSYSFNVGTAALWNAGGPESLTVGLAIGEDDSGSLMASTSLPHSFLEGYLEDMILALGDSMGDALPVELTACRIVLRADGDHIFVDPTSSVDVIGSMDLRCAPHCGIGVLGR